MADAVATGPEVAQRLGELRERLLRAGGDHVRVVAVTKGFGPEAVDAALGAGLSDIGENYAQELLAKAGDLGEAPIPEHRPRWHFIGRLQRNKIRKIAPLVDLWQSVDRAEVAVEIARWAPGAPVLVQVDVAGRGGRGGCAAENTASVVAECRNAGLEVAGLMAVGEPGPPENARGGFRQLATQARDLGLNELSMGMSADLEVAVEEGSTMIRVGTALFGPRPL